MKKIFLIGAKEGKSGLALESLLPGAYAVPFTSSGVGYISLPSQSPQKTATANAAKYFTCNFK